MRAAVISDIHGNHTALEACLDYCRAQKVDRYIFLGDYLGEFACPELTMDMLYSLSERERCTFIRGNKEDYWLEHRNSGIEWREYDSTTGSLNYIYRRLREKDMQFFAGLPDAKVIRLFGTRMIACHGSPFRTKEDMGPDEKTARLLRTISVPVILRGHSHVQDVFEVGGKTVINGGSAGLSFHAGGWSQFMILEDEPGRDVPGQQVRCRRFRLPTEQEAYCRMISLPYDTELAIRKMQEEGLDLQAPAWYHVTVQVLHGGSVDHGRVLLRAMKLCREDQGYCRWPDVPEKYWTQAVEECEREAAAKKSPHGLPAAGKSSAAAPPRLTLIAAYAGNRVIGAEGRIPWKIPGEQLRFKELTMGGVVVMGRKSFEEIKKPLPGRTTVVLSGTKVFGERLNPEKPFGGPETGRIPGELYTASSLEDVFAAFPGRELFIAGGAGVYAETLPLADRLCLTEIDADIPGDTFFPEIPDPEAWEMQAGEWVQTNPPYRYLTFTKKPGL